MKAFLLAAGLGTRLKPLTNNIPKCLIPINGIPLLHIWLDLLESAGIDEVLINTHYFADKIEKAILGRVNKIKIILYYEKELKGSGGTIKANYEFVKDEDDFFILYSDNLTNVSLQNIWNFHKSKDSIFTTYVYETNVPTQKGIFTAEPSGKVISFEEKPTDPKNNLANAGIGVLNKKVFNYIEGDGIIDFGKNVMPKISDKMYILLTRKYIIDIGTTEDYKAAEIDWHLINNYKI